MAEMTAAEAIFVLKKSTILSSGIKSKIINLLKKYAAREMAMQDIIKNADSFAYCPNCQIKVASCRITFEELHDSCGHTVLWIEDAAPIIVMQNLLEQQSAAIAKLQCCGTCYNWQPFHPKPPKCLNKRSGRTDYCDNWRVLR